MLTFLFSFFYGRLEHWKILKKVDLQSIQRFNPKKGFMFSFTVLSYFFVRIRHFLPPPISIFPQFPVSDIDSSCFSNAYTLFSGQLIVDRILNHIIYQNFFQSSVNFIMWNCDEGFLSCFCVIFFDVCFETFHKLHID